MVLRRSASSSRKGCWGTVASPKTPHRVRYDALGVKHRLLYVVHSQLVQEQHWGRPSRGPELALTGLQSSSVAPFAAAGFSF